MLPIAIFDNTNSYLCLNLLLSKSFTVRLASLRREEPLGISNSLFNFLLYPHPFLNQEEPELLLTSHFITFVSENSTIITYPITPSLITLFFLKLLYA